MLGDFPDKDEAKRAVDELRAEGRKAFAEHSPEGYSRVFREVKPGDEQPGIVDAMIARYLGEDEIR